MRMCEMGDIVVASFGKYDGPHGCFRSSQHFVKKQSVKEQWVSFLKHLYLLGTVVSLLFISSSNLCGEHC